MRETYKLGGKRRHVNDIEEAQRIVNQHHKDTRREGSLGAYSWVDANGRVVAEAWLPRHGPGWNLVVLGDAPPYRMKRVVEAFKKPSRADESVLIPYLRLECGHEVADKESLYYSGEVAVRVRALAREMGDKPRRVRCRACASEERAQSSRKEGEV